MDVRFLIFLIALFVLLVLGYAVTLRYWPAERKALVKRLIYTAVIGVPFFIYLLGEEDRFVHYLEAQGYTDVRIEHPNQFHCLMRESAYSYRARLPNGTSVHGGVCIILGFFYTITEPIGEKYFPRG